jgi:hypothetical protein
MIRPQDFREDDHPRAKPGRFSSQLQHAGDEGGPVDVDRGCLDRHDGDAIHR